MVELETQIKKMDDVETVKNNEEVRIYRLGLLEENQIKILRKIDELEDKLEIKYDAELNKHDKRITFLEKRNDLVDKVIWLVGAETVTLIFLFIQKFFGG